VAFNWEVRQKGGNSALKPGKKKKFDYESLEEGNGGAHRWTGVVLDARCNKKVMSLYKQCGKSIYTPTKDLTSHDRGSDIVMGDGLVKNERGKDRPVPGQNPWNVEVQADAVDTYGRNAKERQKERASTVYR